LLPEWSAGDGASTAAALAQFAASYTRGIRQHCNVDPNDEDDYRRWETDVSRWLYSAEHVTLAYSLEYDGLDIRRLSPGTRGIVLLLLYLAVDTRETVPLIIDQPEENLDPESIYTELVALFRSAARRRQVIMVTHNANLVVNSEVDQVIVARCGSLEMNRLPELRYESGGLEDPSIRSAVCRVLEGGEAAFRERARRLRVEL
jgi:energy-coupling factor transporter ATP-binding protein EcfA2